MRRYFTRALALSLAFTLALALLPGAALATKVYVGDTEVSAGGYWKADGAGGLALVALAAGAYGLAGRKKA